MDRMKVLGAKINDKLNLTEHISDMCNKDEITYPYFRNVHKGRNYLSILKLQWLHCRGLGMDKEFQPKIYNECNHLSMLFSL